MGGIVFHQVKSGYRIRFQPAGIIFILALVGAIGALVPPAVAAEESPGLIHPESLESLYRAREGRPVWIAADGRLNGAARTLLSILRNADRDGLQPADYHGQALAELLNRPNRPTPFVPLNNGEVIEPLLTDAFLAYGLDLSLGRIDPGLVFSRWETARNLAETLEAMLDILVGAAAGWETPCFDPAGALHLVRPDHFGYRSLQTGLAYYRWVDQSGGWPAVPAGETLRPGDRDPRVALLRARLTGMTGPDSWLLTVRHPVSPWNWFVGILPVSAAPKDPEFFDPDLEAAVKSFQKRHGLNSDGLVGKYTLAALNESAAHKANRIVLNLERIRWMPPEPADPFIKVNIPSCRLDMMDQGQSILSMKTVVGRPDRPTPVMHDQVRYVEVNPSWNVPQKLARKDILPQVLDDPQYLQDRDFHVYENWKRGAAEIDVATIDWVGLESWNMAYRFRQDPGPRNPLGRMKFLFPNEFSVYLHDTNQREYFARESRALSSGCIRLEDPKSLAQLLAPEKDFTDLLESEETRTLGLANRVPIFIVYQTAWIDNSGRVNFAPDIYGYDARMLHILVGEEAEILVSN